MRSNMSFVQTIQERCRMCYTCVRECPAKAIRISVGQAEIVGERCINCGNCVRVCSQAAKQVISSVDEVRALLASGARVAMCLAPSFPAAFPQLAPEALVGMVRKLGFPLVCEVAFGADLVAQRYRELAAQDGPRYLSSPCPAIISYVEKYHPDLVPSLAPIVSPMIALARALHRLHGDGLKVVFAGPCIAKKREAGSVYLQGDVAAALTFVELQQMFDEAQIAPASVEPTDFDPPHAGLGALFPISRGLLQAANLPEDLLQGDVVSADGRTNFVQAIKEFDSGALTARLLDILACMGCLTGAGMTGDDPLFGRRTHVADYVRGRMATFHEADWRRSVAQFDDLDLSRTFAPDDKRMPAPSPEALQGILARLGKNSPEDELNCGACGYETCREHATAIYRGLAENDMCLPRTIVQLHDTVKQLTESHEQLASTQEALLNAEKLASMGQLAAGIAHEVNNPLGIVLMYAHLLRDEARQRDGVPSEDLQMIVEQADRCKKIVSGLLSFARQSRTILQPTDLGELIERTVKLMHLPESITVHIERPGPVVAEADRDQITQVLTNLISNAEAAMPHGGTLTFRVAQDGHRAHFSVTDTGCGIPKANLGKIFQPFFTTKTLGKGTGLGLAVTYGIVKMHSGDITVESEEGKGSTFRVALPLRGRRAADAPGILLEHEAARPPAPNRTNPAPHASEPPPS
jgi:signal transduction histidine kinase/Pyruvate/2-oxoacid:ferredoxin oxidoreductase delta subunit